MCSIAINLNGNAKILLENSQVDGTDCNDQCEDGFCVADPNRTDGSAKLCLKDPFPTWKVPCIPGVDERSCDGVAVFRIFARVRGKGSMDLTACVEDTSEGGTINYCDTGNTVTVNTRKATDISQSLLTLCYDGDGIGLFDQLCFDADKNLIQCVDDAGGIEEQYFWDVDNDGVRNAELRFYDQDDLDELVEGTGCTWDEVTRGNAC